MVRIWFYSKQERKALVFLSKGGEEVQLMYLKDHCGFDMEKLLEGGNRLKQRPVKRLLQYLFPTEMSVCGH